MSRYVFLPPLGTESFVCFSKSTVGNRLYLGLYGIYSILLMMKISLLLAKIWMLLMHTIYVSYIWFCYWQWFIHHYMNKLALIILLLSLIFFSTKTMENLNINGDNGATSSLPQLSQAELLDLCLVGRVVVNKPIFLATLEERLGPMWDPKQKMTLIPMENNKFMVQLYQKGDLARILDGSPWLLDNNMVILKKVAVGENPLSMSMNTTKIWAQVHQLPFGFMDAKVGALVGSHIGRMVRYDDENNYGPWRRFMRVRVEIALEEPLQQSLVIEREQGEDIKLVLKYEKLGKFCFVCGAIGHTEGFCSVKFETSFARSEKKWGAYLRAENFSSGGGSKVASRWIVDGRNKNSGGRNDEGTSINGIKSNHLMVIDGISNHKIYGRIKVDIDLLSRALKFFKFMECQRSDGTGLVRWWTEIDPTEEIESGSKKEEVITKKKLFAPNLTKSDQLNKALAEGMTEKDEFLYENGGGAEALWKLIDLEAQQKNISPENSMVGDSQRDPRGDKGKEEKEGVITRVPQGDSRQTRHTTQGQLVLCNTLQQQVVPQGQKAVQQSLNIQYNMTGTDYRRLFTKEAAQIPINAAFSANNCVIQVQKVDQIQTLMNKSIKDQSSALSPIFTANDYRPAFSTKDKNCQPSRAKPVRKDKAAAAVQVHGKSRKPPLVRSPVQPDSFMAAARGASRASGPVQENGPKKRSRTDFAEEEHRKEGQKAVDVFNNPLFEKNKESAGPGHQACRDQ